MIEDGHANRDGDTYTPGDGHPLLRLGQGDYAREVHAEDLGEPLGLIDRGSALIGSLVIAGAASVVSGGVGFLLGRLMVVVWGITLLIGGGL